METNQPSSNAAASYADPAALIAQVLLSFNPPERISTADWAAANRYLENHGGGYVGLWTHEKAPYLVGIMDALDSPDYTTVALAKPGQCGGTESALNWLLKSVATDPAAMLWYMPTEDTVEAYVKKVVNPAIESHAQIRNRLGAERTDNSLKFKGFAGMPVEFLPATRSHLISKSAPRIVMDEWDAVDLQGTDPKTLLDVRRQTFGRESKLFALSHMDRARGSKPALWTSGIMSLYRDSTRCTWWWPCPQCGMHSSPNPGTRFHMSLEYDAEASLDDIADQAHLLCPHNGCIVLDTDRRAMNARGKWIGHGQNIDEETGEITGALAPNDTAGFWIVGVMSPFLFGGIGGLARALVKAQRDDEAEGIDRSAREVCVKQLGVPHDPPNTAGTVDAETLANRADETLRLGIVPAGVRFITCAIDVQGNRFEVIFRGWGVDRESWIIDRRIFREISGIPADPATNKEAWDHVFTVCMLAEFPLDDATGRVMRVRAVACDSGGQAGVTQQAYDAWRRRRTAVDGTRAKMMGIVGGRETYNLLLLKGASGFNASTLSVVKPDAQRSDRRAAARGEVPLGVFSPTSFKDQLATQLRRAEPGPGYVHVPAPLREPKPPYRFFEQLVAEKKALNGRWEKTSARNEALDLMVMNAVIAHLHAPSRFDWTRPPPWARAWDQNPLVGPPTPAVTPAEVAVRLVQALAPSIVTTTPPAPQPAPATGIAPPPGARLSLKQIIAQGARA